MTREISEIQDQEVIRSQAPRMNNREVPLTTNPLRTIPQLPQDSFVLLRLIVQQCTFSHLHTLWHHIVPWQVGSANGSISGSWSKTHSKRPMFRNSFFLFMLRLNVPVLKVRVMLFPRLLRCRYLSYRHRGINGSTKTKTQLVLGNVLRHHCLVAATIYMWALGITLLVWCLQLEPWAPTWKGGRFWETDCGEMAYCCPTRKASDYVEHDILQERFHLTHYEGCAILFQQGHLPPRHQGQIDLPSWHNSRFCVLKSWKEDRDGSYDVLSRAIFRRPPVGGRKYFAVLYSFFYQQHLCLTERHCQEGHAHSSCHHVFSRSWLGCRWLQLFILATFMPDWKALPRRSCWLFVPSWFSRSWVGCRWLQWYCMAVSRQRRPQCCWLFAYATGPPTIVGTWIHPEQLGRRLWISQLPSSQRFWKVSKHGAFSRPRQALDLWLSVKAAIMIHGFIYISLIWTVHGPIKRTAAGTSSIRNDLRVLDMELKKKKKRYIIEVMSDYSLSSWVRNYLRSLVLVTSLAHYHEVTWTAHTCRPDCHRWGEFCSIHPSVSHLSFSSTITTCNELYSYHNKIEWAIFVWMLDSWPQLHVSTQESLSQFIVKQIPRRSGVKLNH